MTVKKSPFAAAMSAVGSIAADLLSSVAVNAAVDAVPNNLTAKDKERLRRATRKGMQNTAKSIGRGVATAAKKVKEKVSKTVPVSQDIALGRLQLITACKILAMEPPVEGKLVDLEKARSNKRAAAKLFHPDVAGDGGREKFELVVKAFEMLESYNESLNKKGV